MKLECGKRARVKMNRLREWHRFYAILPRKVGYEDCRMFEWIERRLVLAECWDGTPNFVWEYRAIRNERG